MPAILLALQVASQLVPIVAQYAPEFVTAIKKAAGQLPPDDQAKFQTTWDAMRSDLRSADADLDAKLTAAGH